MEAIAAVLMVAVFVFAFEGKGWIEAHWKGRAEAAREERLAAEARTELARINAEASRIPRL